LTTAVFPTLSGLKWDVKKRPRFNTIVQRTASGKEVRAGLMSYPLWEFELSYDALRAAPAYAELQTLAGFFELMYGSLTAFNYNDPTDNSVTAQVIGTGNGAATQFQLVRSMGNFVEPVQNVNVITGVYDNGSPVTQGAGAGKYTINNTGLVTFGTAPVAGHTLTWTGTYYFLCRFLDDIVEFNNFMYNLFECQKLGFVSVKQ
jgi:uncharacterized protein (TIGR02217 family)